MKKTLLTSAVLMLVALTQLSAQNTITTWYVIPPTSGCNGVWAVDASQFTTGCGTPPFQYILNPAGCANIMSPTVVNDTVYWPLCAFPCDLTTMDMNGVTCICGTGTTTNTVELSSQHIVTAYPNPSTSVTGWNILLHEPGSAITVNIYNAMGELVLSQSEATSAQIFHVDTSALTAGTYFTEITVNGASPYHQKLVLTQ